MANPKSKTSRSKRNMRRSHDGLASSRSHMQTCSNTGQFHSSHKAHKAADGAYYFKGNPISMAKAKSDEDQAAE